MSQCSATPLTLAALTKDDTALAHYVPPPCQVACPIGTDVGSYVGLIWNGDLDGALEAITATNPFSSVCGRVCDAPCEPACRRANSDGPIAIRALKRYVMDRLGPSHKLAPIPVTRPEKVAIVGSGPAGLTAAQDLAAAGLTVDVYEALDRPGGMMAWGIPDFRLPPEVVQGDIERIQQRCAGLTIRCNSALGRDYSLDSLADSYDAVLLAIGASVGKSLGVPGDDLPGVMDGVSFLNRVNGGERPMLPETVLVVGGGDVAMDACRVARRLPGVKTVKVVYRRGPAEIPARAHELHAAEAEGIEILYNTQPVSVEKTARGLSLRCVTTALGEPGPDGRRKPVTVEGSEHGLDCGLVIAAVGQKSVSLELARHGLMDGDKIATDTVTMRTRHPKVFAAGDGAFGGSTLVQAMYSGHRAAYYVLAALDGETQPAPYKTPYRTRSVPVAQDPLWEKLPVKEPRLLPIGEDPFADAEEGYDDNTAHEQAARCYRCDTETGSTDYTVKNREAIFEMAKIGMQQPADLARLTAGRLAIRPDPFPAGHVATFDDLTFLPANLTRLVIDPYRESCNTRVELAPGLSVGQPLLACGFEDAPAEVRRAVALGQAETGGAHLGTRPLDGVPWLQLLTGQAKADPAAVAVIKLLAPHEAPSRPVPARDGQKLGLAACSNTVEAAVHFAVEQGLDLLVLDGSGALAAPWAELAGPPDLSVITKAIKTLRALNAEETVGLVYYGAVRSGSDVAKALSLGCQAAASSVALAIAAGGVVQGNRVEFEDTPADERADGVRQFLKAAASETSMMARCTGKTDIRNLEPEDLRSITLAAQSTTGIVMAGVKKAG